ncbi:hypothetical protein EON81_22105, partial [bacterium]
MRSRQDISICSTTPGTNWSRSATRSGGAHSVYAYDPKSRLTDDTTTGPGAHRYTYSYSPTDERLSSSETGAVVAYAYNLAGRLLASNDGAAYA